MCGCAPGGNSRLSAKFAEKHRPVGDAEPVNRAKSPSAIINSPSRSVRVSTSPMRVDD